MSSFSTANSAQPPATSYRRSRDASHSHSHSHSHSSAPTAPAARHDAAVDALRRLAKSLNHAEPSPLTLKHNMRILGSAIGASTPDEQKTLAAIHGRLLNRAGG